MVLPHSGIACRSPPLFSPDGLTPSEPRSVRADIIPGSERSAATRHASAGQGSEPRRPGVGAPSTPFGRAAERASSAARVSPGHSLAPAAAAPRPPLPVYLRSRAARCRTLRDSPRGVWFLSPLIRGLRLVRSLRRYRVATPTLAPNSGYRLPARSAAFLSPLPAGWCCLTPVSPAVPPCSRRMVLSPSEPRSVRADIIPGSERSATGVPRRPGVGAPSTSFGRAAERARSAARASPGLLLAHAAATSAPTTPPDWGGRRPPTFVNPAMTPAGRLGGAGVMCHTDLRR